MEVELVTEALSEDENYSIDDFNEDYSNFEGERCGICMDVVIDRGVLDCCQHWFCFTCIDNWASITNLCPLCQQEFQLITCVPVYDTIGNNKSDEDIHSRDDDWSIDGNDNTLSFPSYYIDENAVACLDGDDCKFRSGIAVVEEDSNLDTSIACDSCDKWYHAFCVGFDTEGTCEGSWLCPRCLLKERTEGSEGISSSRPSKQIGLENASSECLAGKVLVSVADVGETALVVSMVEENQMTQESRGHFPMSDFGKDLKVDVSLSKPIATPKLETVSWEESNVEPNLGTQGLELSLSHSSFFPSSSPPVVLSDLMTNSDEEKSGALRLLDGFEDPSSELYTEPNNEKMRGSCLDLHLGLSVSSSSGGAKDQVPEYVQQKYDSGECLLPAEKVVGDEKEMLCTKRMVIDHRENGVVGAKRKHIDSRDDDGESKANTEAKISSKKAKAEGKSKHSQPKAQAHEYKSGGSQKKPKSVAVSKAEIGRRSSSEKESVSNIMDIVQERKRKPPKQLARPDPSDTSSREREHPSGVRVKKILRRASNDKDVVVQTLRKEIREAVRNKSSKELGKNHFDPKLLAAFRAVVAGQTTETKRISVDLKAKKLLLQKGKVRENLTKKIYGVGGKRQRAWTRECDIEFWKYRCSTVSKPEKVKTLKSVLDLLRCDPDDKKAEHDNEGEASNTFLSRLYLADASVCPRKNDIKPASVRDVAADQSQNKERTPTDKVSTTSSSNLSGILLQKNGVNPPLDTKATKKIVADTKSGATKATSQKESVDNLQTDKRKWALELLARKTAVVSKNTTQEKEEDKTMIKGNYPILAQLPKDMRPELSPIRHNKIPASVRQAQLYRLAEHFLRKANLQVIRRTAETELAIADATNIEKEIAERSNSKLVYVNLCSQELRRRTDSNSVKVTESNASSASEVTFEKAEPSSAPCNDLEVDQALKAAGLLSDSPPGSPHRAVDEIKEEVAVSGKSEDDGPDNILEVDSHLDLDIYGDFEYDIEDDDFIGASALKISKPQPEDSKIKLVLSTLNNTDKLDGAPDVVDHEKSAIVEALEGSCGSPDHHISSVSSAVDASTDNCPFQSSTLDDVGEELSLEDCDELYGPDKEPLVQKYPETASVTPYEPLVNNEKSEKKLVNEANVENSEKATSPPECPLLSENSSNHSKISDSAPEKEKTSKTKTKNPDSSNIVAKKVEVYIKEHIRPLCKSGVITVEQYRWAVGKTTEKVMKYHSKDKNANFLIKEGEKVKKLAEQYVETAQQMPKTS